jgi:hypothetical protein
VRARPASDCRGPSTQRAPFFCTHICGGLCCSGDGASPPPHTHTHLCACPSCGDAGSVPIAPGFYGLDSLESADVEAFLFDIVDSTFADLEAAGCVALVAPEAPPAKGCVCEGGVGGVWRKDKPCLFSPRSVPALRLWVSHCFVALPHSSPAHTCMRFVVFVCVRVCVCLQLGRQGCVCLCLCPCPCPRTRGGAADRGRHHRLLLLPQVCHGAAVPRRHSGHAAGDARWAECVCIRMCVPLGACSLVSRLPACREAVAASSVV